MHERWPAGDRAVNIWLLFLRVSTKASIKMQEMMRVMVSERGGKLYSTDDRYCIDNGAMIAWPGLLAFQHGLTTPLEESTCTQRFRTDDVLVTWRD